MCIRDRLKDETLSDGLKAAISGRVAELLEEYAAMPGAAGTDQMCIRDSFLNAWFYPLCTIRARRNRSKYCNSSWIFCERCAEKL